MNKKAFQFFTLAVIAASMIFIMGGTMKDKPDRPAQKENTTDLWKKVAQAEKDGLPQTAADLLKKIAAIALEQKNQGEFLRALSRQLILESVIKGNKPESRITRLQEEMEKAPAEMRPMMKLILAEWYRHYYSRNRWRFMNRSATAGLDEKDFTTWDLPRLFQEIDSLYRDVLKEEEFLKKTPLSGYSDFLIPGDHPSSLRPTLFDFVVFEALDFYTAGEQAAAQPEEAFLIEADSPALALAEEFLSYKPETADVASPKLQALKLFQQVLAFHREDKNRDIFLDADLQRLRYARNTAVGEEISPRYQQRLKEIAEANPESLFSSQAYYAWAQELYDEGKLAEAKELAGRGEKLHPTSFGATNCRALVARIIAKEFSLRAETVLQPEKPGKLAVDYRNITSLYFRVVKEDFSGLLSGKDAESLFWLSDATVSKLIRREPSAQWAASLKPTADYKAQTALIDIPPLKPGYYKVLASFNKAFSPAQNKIQSASFWVSDLGLVTRSVGGDTHGFVVRNASGEPVASAQVIDYMWNYNTSSLEKAETVQTDSQGLFSLKSRESYRNRVIFVRAGDGAEIAEIHIPSSYAREARPFTQTVFFTDRSLCRPGQMIFFKGLCLNINSEQNSYALMPKQKVKVTFRDVNRQEISSLDLVTNEFGSLSGTFVAPTDRLTGEMRISSEYPPGSCSIRVEEYKRPKFQVKLDVPDQEFRLNDTVSLPGEAMAYTGAPVDNAQVRFRVTRTAQVPWWWYGWYESAQRGGAQEIAHGILRTDEAGKFVILFKAKPDLSISAAARPIFTYSISVDVTDSAGETRSDSGHVRVGYVSLEAQMESPDWQEEGKPVAITIRTATLNNKKVGAQGVVEVFSLKGPLKPVPADLIGEVKFQEQQASLAKEYKGFAETPDWRKWPEGELVAKKEFETSAKEDVTSILSFDLKKGAYKARLKTKDRYGTEVEAVLAILVLKPEEKQFGVRIPFHDTAKKSSAEVGETYELLWATGYEKSPVLVEIFQNSQKIDRYWTDPGQTQGVVSIPVKEKLRGGFTVLLSMVKENRYYSSENRAYVPWSNKELSLAWRTFRSKLQPGQKETWSLDIKGPKAMIKAAEMVAALYDASLDQFYPHGFPGIFGIFKTDWTSYSANFTNRRQELNTYRDNLNPYSDFISPTYIHFPPDIEEDSSWYAYPSMVRMAAKRGETMAEVAEAPPAPAAAQADKSVVGGVVGGVLGGVVGEVEKPAEIDLSQVQARKNLNETAFFFPHVLSDKDGLVTLEFQIPEALTEWRFLGFAHTKDLESGSIEARTVTQKDLMVQPNPPRFMREDDNLEFTVKVTNMAEKEAQGAVELSFFDPRTDRPLDASLKNDNKKFSFTIPAKQSRSFSWPLVVPDGLELVSYKALAATAEFSDGEEGVLPVLSRRIFVRESLPLWISDKGEKTFVFTKLLKSAESPTLQHKGLVVQMASNPAWYAIQALPFLMEFPYECSEQIFNRLYANSLAQKIANSSPRIRKIFDQWKGTEALKSNLEKNEDLKSALLQESPWVLEAKAETEAKHKVGLLFDENRMSQELKSAYSKLENMQLGDGSWPWFPGGQGNSYITLYILTGFGRVKHLGVGTVSQNLALKALSHLDQWITEEYEYIREHGKPEENHLSSTIALYLYGRSFYLKEQPIPDESREAVDYFLKQAAKYWLQLDWRQSQAHLALGLKRFGDSVTAQKIMRSMKERSQVDEEMGRYWSELELSWWWYRAPIETQAVMIEAFDEVMNDQKAVEECKIWLLKQKQTQDWKTTKATADAVYGLVLKGVDLLASDSIVEVSLGGKKVEPEKVEAGTGFYEKRFESLAIVSTMGNIVVKKVDPGIAWGGLHWQYMEDISRITPHAQNPLKLKKSVFLQKLTGKGPVIEPLKGPLAVGDTLIIRIELRTDRDMEYVHMKDHRGSGLEPINVLSRYKYQGGLVYYESTKDTATHFFIDYLPKGTYVFEYPLRVVHRGTYQNGLAHIECMYAPEFNSHSESVKLEVK